MLNMQNLDRLACLTGSLAKYVMSTFKNLNNNTFFQIPRFDEPFQASLARWHYPTGSNGYNTLVQPAWSTRILFVADSTTSPQPL
jgi:hypothetical protein